MRPDTAAATLRRARDTRRTIAPFTDTDPSLDEQWGHDVQALDRRWREEHGQTVVGAKLGLTSAAKQQRMQVDQPIVGFLTDAMRVEADGLADASRGWAQPRIEPEIAFVTATAISSPLTLTEAARVVDAVSVAAEVIDSRYEGYRFRLPDVVADNTSAAGFLLGHPVRLTDLDDLVGIRGELEVDGQVVDTATGAAILGHPLLALVQLSEHLGRQGQTLPAGSIVLAGALTDAVPLAPGTRYTVRMGALGSLTAEA